MLLSVMSLKCSLPAIIMGTFISAVSISPRSGPCQRRRCRNGLFMGARGAQLRLPNVHSSWNHYRLTCRTCTYWWNASRSIITNNTLFHPFELTSWSSKVASPQDGMRKPRGSRSAPGFWFQSSTEKRRYNSSIHVQSEPDHSCLFIKGCSWTITENWSASGL